MIKKSYVNSFFDFLSYFFGFYYFFIDFKSFLLYNVITTTIKNMEQNTMEANTQIAHRLKSLREQNGLEQLELAEKMGYKSQSTISKWERGVNLPNGGKLVKLATILGTTTDYILFGEELETEPEKPVIEITRIADFAMMLDGKPLTDEEKDKFESLVKLYFGDKYGEDK